MVSILLRRGADVNKRCHGAFFCAEDQKSSRTDSLEHEYVELSTKTNYTGRMYFGEYPLHFAACMNQPECYRAVKFVGPFVLMIYTIIASDLSRFIVIYIIFLVGFSQSFDLIFTACERAAYTANVTVTQTTADDGDSFQNLIPNPQEALIRTFIMTIGEFMSLYRELAACDSLLMSTIGKVCFILFEMGVSILQFNLLIAMMTRTYEEIFQTSKEWKRQWAQ
ncbi:unnamed protein product, partial [Mesorhabditis spiculigera]